MNADNALTDAQRIAAYQQGWNDCSLNRVFKGFQDVHTNILYAMGFIDARRGLNNGVKLIKEAANA